MLIRSYVNKLKSLALKKKIERRHFLYGSFFLIVLVFSSFYLLHLSPYHSSTSGNPVEYVRAKVLEVEAPQSSQSLNLSQEVQVKVLDGSDKCQVTSVARSYIIGDPNSERLPIGSEVLLTIDPSNGNQFSYLDRYRIPGAITLFLLLLALVLIIGRWRGFTGVLGLVISIGALLIFVIPRIIAGHAAFATCIEGAFIIAPLSIYVAHGFRKRTTIALASTLATLVIIVGLSVLAVHITGVIGNPGATVNAEQETSLIQYAPHHIDLLGLFLGGMIIASLGVLEDITTAQAAAVDEIHKANSKLSGLQLYKRGLSVGHEHVAALINTLALVYVGAALPTIVLTVLYASQGPLAATLNDEVIMEAIVRTAVASIGLLLAVPLATGLAAYVLPKWYKRTFSN